MFRKEGLVVKNNDCFRKVVVRTSHRSRKNSKDGDNYYAYPEDLWKEIVPQRLL